MNKGLYKNLYYAHVVYIYLTSRVHDAVRIALFCTCICIITYVYMYMRDGREDRRRKERKRKRERERERREKREGSPVLFTYINIYRLIRKPR